MPRALFAKTTTFQNLKIIIPSETCQQKLLGDSDFFRGYISSACSHIRSFGGSFLVPAHHIDISGESGIMMVPWNH